MIFCASSVFGAQLKLPVKTIGGESFYYYKVKKNESVYAVAQKLNISKDDIIKYNPSASEGFVKNQILFFPVAAYGGTATPTTKQASTSRYGGNETIIHTVKSGETVYGISKAYGISQEKLIEANPSINVNMRAGDEIVIPVKQGVYTAPAATATAATGSKYVTYHTIKRGETLYSVAHKYNTTIENLIALNPGLGSGNFKADDVIKIQPNTPSDIQLSKEYRQFVPYTVKEGDTFESVAKSNNVTAQQLRDNNSGVDKLKKGKVIYIPKSGYEMKTVNSSKATAQELERTYNGKIGSVYAKEHNVNTGNEINLGIILPFQLHKQDPPKQALLYTEFYKGFLMAADSISRLCHKKIHIDVYDTEHNLNKTDSILALPALKNLSLIIAPSEPKQLERINKFGEKNNIPVINCFSLKNDDYTDNSKAIQTNVPASYLATFVGEWFCNKFKGQTVVFLEDPETDDKEIYSYLKDYITAKKLKTKTLTIVNELTAKKLSQYMDPGVNYVFLPNSGAQKLTSKFIDALTSVKSDRFDCNVTLMGYPEYVLYNKDLTAKLQTVDTYFFTRFFCSNNAATRSVESKYKARFGESMMNTAPKMGLLGFDVAMYAIKTLNDGNDINENSKAYHGLQSSFNLMRVSNWGGLVNKSYLIVRYSSSHQPQVIVK